MWMQYSELSHIHYPEFPTERYNIDTPTLLSKIIYPIVVILQAMLKISPELSREGVNLFLRPIVMRFSTNYFMMTEEHRFQEIRIQKTEKWLYSMSISTYSYSWLYMLLFQCLEKSNVIFFLLGFVKGGICARLIDIYLYFSVRVLKKS